MKAIEFLIQNQSDNADKWREEAECRRRNARWLRYSAMIALQVRGRMAESDFLLFQLLCAHHAAVFFKCILIVLDVHERNSFLTLDYFIYSSG